MKITRVVNHGQTRFRVNVPHGPDGKRQRRFFDSQEAAARFVKERTADTRAFGIHVASITPADRAAIAHHLQRLRLAGWTLAAAADFVLKAGKAPPAISLRAVADEFLASRRAAACRPRYLRKLRASIERFILGREAVPIAEITAAHVTDYVTANGWKPTTMRSYLVDVRSLFSFAVEREYLRKSPAAAVPLPKLDEAAPGILTPEQVRAFLDACLTVAPDALAVAALCLFGGLRREEAEQFEWADILDEFVEVKAHKAKTRRRRLIPISAQLRAWLEVARASACPMPAFNFRAKLPLAAERAGLQGDWPQNALRHSFASYHYAKHRSATETAFIMGNSPQMLFQHYRELVRPAAAEVFFGLLPPPDAAARALAARAGIGEATRLARVAAAHATHRSRAERKRNLPAPAPAARASADAAPAIPGNEKAGPVETPPGLD
jgi:integrase